MVTCYLWGTNKFLRYRTLCMSILKYRFSRKSIELTPLILFEVLQIPQPWATLVYFELLELLWAAFSRNYTKLRVESMNKRVKAMEWENLPCLINWWDFVFIFRKAISSFPFLVLMEKFKEACTTSSSDNFFLVKSWVKSG